MARSGMVEWEDPMHLPIVEAKEYSASPKESRAGVESVRGRPVGDEGGH